MLVAGSGATFANSHLPAEGAAEAKVIIIEPSTRAIGVAERLQLRARICNADRTACKPAKKARWRMQPKSIVGIGQKRGAVTILEGRAAGTVSAS